MFVLRRLRSACLTWPKAGEWLVCLMIYGVTAAAISAIGLAFGLVHWQPRFDGWSRHLGVFVIPALGEELVFRGLLVPARDEGRDAVRWIAIGTLAFVLWHVLEATAFLPGAGLFLRPAFLMCAGLLGLACAVTRWYARSLWPAVLFHGAVVFAWQVLFGGPAVTDLLR